MDLTGIYEAPSLSINYLRQPQYVDRKCTEANEAQVERFKTLEMDIGIPTPMNELQGRFFTDFVFIWRSYIDDPLTWRYDSPVFRALSIAILRLAAWDFEVSFDCDVELPISFASIPRWRYPETGVYWFHGYLVVLQDGIESEAMINEAVSKAKSYLNNSRLRRCNIYMIVVSPRRIAFVELSHNTVLVSRRLILLSNHSATECSPGFRALARVLTSNCWKMPHAYRERWQNYIPREIVQMILHELKPRDTVAFAQASFAAKQCYYASESQFKNVAVQNFKSSIPCCGKRSGLETHGICCSKCHAWQHLECVGLESYSSSDQYVCTGCHEETYMVLDPGGINRFSCRKGREGSQVKVGGSAKSLQLRLSKPSHLRRELQFLGNLVSVAPSLVQYTILFNHSFSGLAYGLEDSS